MVATYWLARFTSGTPIVSSRRFGSGPVTAKWLVVLNGSAKTRNPGAAATLVTAVGPVTVRRMAPSAPAFGGASVTLRTAPGLVESRQLAAPASATTPAPHPGTPGLPRPPGPPAPARGAAAPRSAGAPSTAA